MKKIERKDFLKLTGGAVVGGLTGFVFSGAPFQGLQWLVEWTQDQHVPTKGEEKYLKSVCDSCPNKCTLTIRKIAERAVKIETSNSACPFGQNALQFLYHPDRISEPLKRRGKKGTDRFVPVSWDEALKDISGELNKVVTANKRGMIASINGERNLSSELLEWLLKSAGSNNTYQIPSPETLTSAALNGFAEYDFENTDLILSFGARLLDGWGEPGGMHKAFLKWKQNKTKFIHIDTNRTRTASLADEWIAIKPGTELYMALGIAWVLIREKARASKGEFFADWMTNVNTYAPESVAKITGVPAEKIREIAAAFNTARNPVAVSGRGARSVSSTSSELIAVYALNDMVNSKAVTLKKYTGLPANISADANKSLAGSRGKAGLDDFIKNGSFEFLFVNEADPVFKSAYGRELSEKMKKSFVVSISSLMNDTDLYADYILPPLSFLEVKTTAGNPTVKSAAGARHAGDIVIGIAKRIDETKNTTPWNSFFDVITQYGKALNTDGRFSFNPEFLKKEIAEFKKQSSFPLYLIPFEAPYIGDGDGMANPYVLKTIDGDIYSKGRMFVHINRDTAKKYGISENESLDIESERGEAGKVYAHLTDTVAPDVVAVPLGFGHKAYTRYAEDKGINPRMIMNGSIDPLTGTANWWATRVKIS